MDGHRARAGTFFLFFSFTTPIFILGTQCVKMAIAAAAAAATVAQAQHMDQQV
jgi:hypothetical protein